MNTRRIVFSSAAMVLVGAVSVQAASVFPDVAEDHLFRASIEALVTAQVIGGNPDGTFRPEQPVNRAAMLKMLYLAKGQTPDPLSIRCFPDVQPDSWYEPYVCDAAARKYVNGYTDGTFRPEVSVNRVEALKMITTVFGITLDEVTDDNRQIVNFADVSLSAWYTQYLLTAFNTRILPVPGQTGAHFGPDTELSRGEAAAYIHNALHADLTQRRTSSASSSTHSSQATESTASSVSTSSSSATGEQTGTMDTEFPFSREGKFREKQPASYKFDVSANTTVQVDAHLQSSQPGQITCRLYRLEESGFSDRYFLGFQEGNKCHIRATLSAGTYQLQVQPTVANTTFAASVSVGAGDGNDGFADAKRISVNAEQSGVLAASDLEDWFTFSIIGEQNMKVSVQNAAEIRCIVYAMSDVNLASFSGPQCNQTYTYPPGTYFISIGRKAPMGAQQSYTILLEK